MSAPDDAMLQSLAFANMIEAYRAVARHDPAGMVEEADRLVTIATSIPFPLFNPAVLTHPGGDPARLAARARDFYARAGHPGLLLAEDAAAVENAAPLVASGALAPGDPIPGMLLAPIPDPPAAAEALQIAVVATPERLLAYNDTLAAGYGLPRDWLAIFETPATLRIPGLTFYLGSLEGGPVATAMRFTSHRIAGIYSVATLPAFRRRGIGTALTWRAAADGRAEGCLASALQASAEGFPVYRRMGYRHVADYQTWIITPS